jgi:PAS domain S-box-containing protein
MTKDQAYQDIKSENRYLKRKNENLKEEKKELKKTEQSQKRLNEKIKKALKTGSIARWEMELPSGKVTFDKLKAELIGYDPDKFETYQDFTALIHPQDHPRVMQAMEDHLKGKRNKYAVEYRIKTRDNKYRWFRDTGGIYEQNRETGQTRVIGVVQDITEQKDKEHKITHLNRVLHTIRNINQLIGREKKRDKLIKKTCELLTNKGYISAWIGLLDENNNISFSASSGFGDDFEKILNKMKNGEIIECCKRALQTSRVIVIEERQKECGQCPLSDKFKDNRAMTTRIAHKDKIYGFLSLYLPINFAADKEEQKLVKEIADDLGLALSHKELEKERDLSKEKIRIERNRLLAMFDGIEESIYVADPNTYELLHVNKAFKENWGQDGIGKKCYKVLQRRNSPCPFCTNDKIFGENIGKTYIWEFKNRVDERWYRCADKAIKWTDGRMVRFELASDITERKEAENKLKKTNKKLEKSNKELEQFAYVASHDLQEPLRMISSFTKLFERKYQDQVDKDGREFIEYIVEGANRMQKLIEDLLKFSRIQTRGKPFKLIDVDSILEQVERNLKMRIEETDTEIIYNNLPKIKGDPSQMILLFQNLIQNAIKFRRDQSPIIQIEAENRENNWLFKVKDNGIGIEKEYLKKIFRIFQRLHSRKEYQGTGTGLALCKRIVERHGGQIWVESEPGQGSVFYFTITKRRKNNEQ